MKCPGGFGLAVFAWCMSLAGCSFIGVTGPGAEARAGQPLADCTESNALPIVDTVGAVTMGSSTLLFAVAAGVASSQSGHDFGAEKIALAVAGASLVLAILYGTSASYGYTRTAQCRNVLQAERGMGLRQADDFVARRAAVEEMTRRRRERDPETTFSFDPASPATLFVDAPSCHTDAFTRSLRTDETLVRAMHSAGFERVACAMSPTDAPARP